MRMCLKCGGLAYVYYAYQTVECQSCGTTWSIKQYERKKQTGKQATRIKRLHGRQEKPTVMVP
jgi:hypothetical protein